MLNPLRWSFRTQSFAGFIACALLLSFAYYVQFDLDIQPCPLCIFQRIAFIVMGIVFLAAAIQNPRASGRRIYGLLVLLSAFAGIGVAARHIYIQHQPLDPFAGCAPGWNYMISNFPINKVLKMAFTGEADCAEVSWVFLGISMPEWTLLCYVLLGAGAIWSAFRKR